LQMPSWHILQDLTPDSKEMNTITKIAIIISIGCAALVLAKYSQEDKQLRQSEKIILQTHAYLMEFSKFLQKITQLNRELGTVFYTSLKEKERNLKQFDAKLNEIYIELKKQKVKLEKVLTSLEKFGRRSNWWLVKSHKDRYLLNQSSIGFYKKGLKTLDRQLANALKALKEYLAFWPNFEAQSVNNAKNG